MQFTKKPYILQTEMLRLREFVALLKDWCFGQRMFASFVFKLEILHQYIGIGQRMFASFVFKLEILHQCIGIHLVQLNNPIILKICESVYGLI